MSGHNKVFLGSNYTKVESVKVFVCGAGALGSNLLMALAQEGYKNLSVVDFDRIEQGNAYTQVYGLSDVGGMKVQVLKAILARKLRLNLTTYEKRLDPGNVVKMLTGSQLVVDTFDNWESRILVRDTCATLGIPCVHAGMSEEGYSEVIWNEDYTPPATPAVQKDLCEYPLAGPLVHMTAAILQTAVTHYVTTGKKLRRSFTLRDLKLRDF